MRSKQEILKEISNYRQSIQNNYSFIDKCIEELSEQNCCLCVNKEVDKFIFNENGLEIKFKK